MTQNDYHNLPIYDYRGKPLELAYHVTYTLKLKQGYILALRPGQHLVKIPNLLAAENQQRRA